MSALLYCRVSTDEQSRRNSANLPTQERKCREFCGQQGFRVLRVFVDKESARTTERVALQELLSYCREQKGKIKHVIVADLSRLARNVSDQATLITRLTQLGIKLHSVDEPTLDDTAAGRLSANILGCINQFYSDSLSERVRYRMHETIKSGRVVWRAPLGYRNVQNNGSKGMAVDPDRAALVRHAFDLMSTGSHTSEAALRMVTAMGLRTQTGRVLSKQGFSKLMRNPAYCGWVVSGDIKVRGNHEPLISQELFDRTQDVLDGKSVHVPHRQQHEDFPLRGFVRCYQCDKPLTAGWAKGRNKRYPRYWCWQKTCGAVAVSRDELEGQFVSILGMMEPVQELLDKLPEIAAANWSQRKDRITSERRQLSTRLAEQTALNQKAIEAKLNGELSQEDFAVMKAAIAERTAAINEQLKSLESEQSTMDELLEASRIRLLNLPRTWQKAGVNERQEIQSSLFPEGLRYSPEVLFFEPGNHSLIADVRELVDELVKNGRGERI
jgi:site-specific DNA recombinase